MPATTPTQIGYLWSIKWALHLGITTWPATSLLQREMLAHLVWSYKVAEEDKKGRHGLDQTQSVCEIGAMR